MTARAVALDTLRSLSTDELAAHLRAQRGQLFQVRLQQTIGQVENHREIRAIRKEIARTMTVQVEYRLAAERGEAPVAPATPAHESRRARAAQAAEAAAPARPKRSRKAAVAEAQTDAPDADALDAVADVDVELIEPGADPADDDAAIAGTEDDASTEEPATATTTHTSGAAATDEDQE
jgi:ribosomal protein L29